MVGWEYCEVENRSGEVHIAYLTEEGTGLSIQKVAQRKVDNMAVVLARLGREGWEVIAIRGERGHVVGYSSYPFFYTGAGTWSYAFLKRPLASSE